jgi:beta-xylosidase
MRFFLTLYFLLLIIACQNTVKPVIYQNPLMQGSLRMGDPFVLRHQSHYYLYGTNAANRGFKAWRSEDLVEWDSLGWIFEKTDSSYGQSNFWAPEVFYYPSHATFYLLYSTQREKGKLTLCLAESQHPEGPFRDVYTPWLEIEDWQRIDGHVFIDEDQTPYLFFAKVGVVGEPWENPSTGYLYGQIYGLQLSHDLAKAIGDPVLCSAPSQHWENPQSMHSRCNEGPFVLKEKDIYYMTYSANHYAESSYGIGYSTASHPLGPWVKNPDNPLIATDTSIAFSGPGHNSFTTSPAGQELFIIYHAHADWQKPSGLRTVNIDRVQFDEEGRLRLLGPTRTPQPAPK